jgi:hypothetical protein
MAGIYNVSISVLDYHNSGFSNKFQKPNTRYFYSSLQVSSLANKNNCNYITYLICIISTINFSKLDHIIN